MNVVFRVKKYMSSSVSKSICRQKFKSEILLQTLICDLITNSISIQYNIGTGYSYYVTYDVQLLSKINTF